MNLSALQPAVPQDSISALFLPANSADSAEAALFGSLMEQELGAAVSSGSSGSAASGTSGQPPLVSESNGLPAAANGPATANAIGHKKARSKNEGDDNTAAAVWPAPSISLVPPERLQAPNQPLLPGTTEVQLTQTADVSNAPVFGANAKKTLTAGLPQPTKLPQPASSASANPVSPEGLASAAKAEVPQSSVVGQQKAHADNPSLSDALPDQTAPSRRSGETTSRNFEKSEVQGPNENVTDDSGSRINQNQPPNKSSTDAAQFLFAQAVLNFPDAGSAAVPGASAAVAPAVAATVVVPTLPNLARAVPQNSSSGTSSIPQSQVAISNPAEKAAAIAQIAGPPPSQAETTNRDSLEIRDQKSQPAISGLIESQDKAVAPRSSVANGPTHAFSVHHSTIDHLQAGNGAPAGADTANAASDSSRTNVAGSRNSDHNSGQTQDQTNLPQTNAQPATPVQPLASAVTPLAAGPQPAPSAGAAAASQPPPATPVQSVPPKPASHDLPAAIPDASTPVQVHAARIVQADERTEMRMGMQTQAFGALEVHASVSGKEVRFAVTAEHGDLRSFLTPEVPVLQNNLQQHDLRLEHVRTALSTASQQEFSPGSGREERRFSRPHQQPGVFDQQHSTASLDEEDSPGGLNIRI